MKDYNEVYERALYGIPIEEMPVDTHLIERCTYETFTKSHIFTNEDLDVHMDAVDYADKRVLGILGSGDHMFSSIFRECEAYTGIDMTVYSILFSEIKMASMKNLEYQEFMDFLTFDSSPMRNLEHVEPKDGFVGDFFSRNYFERIKHNLSSTARRFFEDKVGKYYIDGYFKENPDNQVPYICHYIQGSPMKDVSHVPYLKSEENYEKTKARLDNVVSPEIIISDIRDCISTLDGPFDIMHLTNIFTYMNNEDMIRLIDESKSILNPGSKIVFYIYVPKGRTTGRVNYNKKREDLEALGYVLQRFESDIDHPNFLLRNAFVIDI